MAYGDNPNPMAANDPMAGGGGDMSEGGMEEIHIGSDRLPKDIKEGDSLVCTGMDDSGCSFRLEKGNGGKEESWEDMTRKEMSPRNMEQGAM